MATQGRIRIGISGWRYAPWRGVFYPAGLPQRRELEFASRMLPTIEINGSFYSLQRPEFYAEWHDATPEGFVFAVKGPKYITHLRRLKEVETPLANFFASGVFELRAKLGPVLWQFAPQMPFLPERFEAFFEQLPRDTEAAATLAPAARSSPSTRSGRCATRSRCATRASSIPPSSHCCAASASRWSSPTPPAGGRCWRT